MTKRHEEAINDGYQLTMETRRWDENTGTTVSMRSKEAANDYRYFPEGDLVTLNISEGWVEEIRKQYRNSLMRRLKGSLLSTEYQNTMQVC